MNEARSGAQSRTWLDTVPTVLLALATVLSAWCGYQSARWSGLQARSYSEAAGARTESAKLSNQAFIQESLHANLFAQWAAAFAHHDKPLSEFIYKRFHPVLRQATEAWLATDPLRNPGAPLSPFDMPQYQLRDRVRAQAADQRAKQKFDEADAANQTSDDYVLLTVSLASVLFLSGIVSQLKRRDMRFAVVVLALIAFLSAVASLVRLPVR